MILLFPLIQGVAILMYLLVLGSLFSQKHSDPANRALRFFMINNLVWAALEFSLYLPVVEGWETLIYRIAGFAWIPSTLWFLPLVLSIARKKSNLVFNLLCLITLGAAIVYATTDLGIIGVVRHDWGVIDIRGPYHMVFAMVTILVGVYISLLVYRMFANLSEARISKAMLLILIGGAASLIVGFVSNIVVPNITGHDNYPRLGSSAAALLVPFVLIAMTKYEFLSVSMAQVAEKFFENVHDGIVLMDRNGGIRRINQMALDILGISDHKDAVQQLEKLLAAGKTTENEGEVEVRHGDAGEEQVLLFSQSKVTQKGVDLGTFVIMSDVTEQKAAQEVLRRSRDDLEKAVELRTRELGQAQKMEALGTLSSGIAHDFNNLLAAIQGFATAARDELPQGNENREDAEEILLAVRQARDIVRQLLDFSTHKNIDTELLEVNKLIDEVLGLIGVSLPLGIELESDIDDESLCISGDRAQILQVLMNLCTNGIQSMGTGPGTLDVILTEVELDSGFTQEHPTVEPGTFVKIQVDDTGTGIPSDVINQIFHPFFTTKGESEGTGLGLATVLRIVQAHSGVVVVETEIGKGSSFSVYIPCANGEEHEESADKESPQLGGSERILFVDDKEQIVRMTTRLLEPLGYSMDAYTNPVEALAAFKNSPQSYDVIITDYMMPPMTGIVLAKRAMAIKDIPIILISGNADPRVKEKGKSVGISVFLDKPLSKSDLVGEIRKLFD